MLCGVLALDVAEDAVLLLYVRDADQLVGDVTYSRLPQKLDDDLHLCSGEHLGFLPITYGTKRWAYERMRAVAEVLQSCLGEEK